MQRRPRNRKYFVAMELLTSAGVVSSSQTRPGGPAHETVANAFRLTEHHFLKKLIPKEGAKKRRVSKRYVVCTLTEKERLASEGVVAGTRPGCETVQMQAVPQSPLC